MLKWKILCWIDSEKSLLWPKVSWQSKQLWPDGWVYWAINRHTYRSNQISLVGIKQLVFLTIEIKKIIFYLFLNYPELMNFSTSITLHGNYITKFKVPFYLNRSKSS